MKKHALIGFLLVSTTLISSCEKDWNNEPAPPPPIPIKDYGQLKVGNYWIYQRFNIDTLGTATALNVFDSCYVEKDTVINGKVYFKMIRPNPFQNFQNDIYFLRDSLHYIVHENGKILFSYHDFTNIFDSFYISAFPYDSICHVVRKMEDINISITVPAGTYVTMNSKLTYYFVPNWSFNGNPRYRSMRFAENIGIVAETFPFFASVPNYTERWLVRYHLQ